MILNGTQAKAFRQTLHPTTFPHSCGLNFSGAFRFLHISLNEFEVVAAELLSLKSLKINFKAQNTNLEAVIACFE